ncbi:MAG TPA: AEC family transporter [Rubrivivax sp.]|nr:AEC family transporter [Rubrivivax sp.]HPO20144.1 AEC family transporter [Rubrivivax sp.]
MTAAVFFKLLAILATVALGWLAGRLRWLGAPQADPARVLSAAAFYIFVPALLFRTTARLDLAALPWRMLVAYFLPILALMLAVHAWQRRRRRHAPALPVAAPAVRAIAVGFGNNVQMGIPMATAVFGEAGLGLHLMVVSVHALVLLSLSTTLVELDLAHDKARREGGGSLVRTLATTVRNTVIHPVVLPVLAGLAWNAAGLGLPALADEVLQLLGSAVVPLCLVLIGLSLAYYGVQGGLLAPAAIAAAKLLLVPALVLASARFGFGLGGLPLAVMVMAAAVPVGANALIFAQRYAAQQAEATAAIVLSTLGYMASAALWLGVLGRLGLLPQ